MLKITLDMDTFKALASDTRVDILKTLDGKRMSLKDIGKIVNLNKATLHVHLAKLHDAGLVKRKERKGHKWVYYKLSWKGASLLHPENTRIVVMFGLTFITLFFGIIGLVNFMSQYMTTRQDSDLMYGQKLEWVNDTIPNFAMGLSSSGQNPILLYIAIGCLTIFTILMVLSVWRYRKNKISKF